MSLLKSRFIEMVSKLFQRWNSKPPNPAQTWQVSFHRYKYMEETKLCTQSHRQRHLDETPFFFLIVIRLLWQPKSLMQFTQVIPITKCPVKWGNLLPHQGDLPCMQRHDWLKFEIAVAMYVITIHITMTVASFE